jgi:hypothetical protein
MTQYAKPLPQPTIDSAPFWEYCRQHELRMQKCADCGHVRYPPGVLCPKCLSESSNWEKLSGRGIVYSWIVFHQQYHPAFAADIPYPVAIVELDEGPHILTNIVQCPLDRIKIGMPVEVVFEDRSETASLPMFRPREQ